MAKVKKVRKQSNRFDLTEVEPINLDDEPDEPDDAETEHIHLFTLGGKEYWAPTEVPFSLAVQSMEIAATEGEAAAIRHQLISLLGEEAYLALVGYDRLTREQFTAITQTANKIIMSSVDRGKAR